MLLHPLLLWTDKQEIEDHKYENEWQELSKSVHEVDPF